MTKISEGKFKAFYNSTAWKKVRKKILTKNFYRCFYCNNYADTVHHITHITKENINNPDITLNEDNLIPVCRACHDQLHERHINTHATPQRRIIFNQDGVPIATQTDPPTNKIKNNHQ